MRLEVVHGDTAVLEDKLGQGTLHLFLGVDPRSVPTSASRRWARETVYLVIAWGPAGPLLPSKGAWGIPLTRRSYRAYR